MLNWIIDISLRHRLLVILAVLAMAIGGGSVAALSRCRCLSRHHARSGADQHGRSGAGPGRSRAADHVPHRAGHQRAAAACRTCDRSPSSGSRRSTVTFADGTDIYFARQLINERLATVELLAGHRPPQDGAGRRPAWARSFITSLRGIGNDPTELRTVQDWVIRPKLRTVRGTAEINSWGGYREAVSGPHRSRTG